MEISPMTPHDEQSQAKPAPDDVSDVGPELEQTDWDALAEETAPARSIPENGDIRYDEGEPLPSLEEEDDNPYQESDEALPDDKEERALDRNLSKEGGRFDEV